VIIRTNVDAGHQMVHKRFDDPRPKPGVFCLSALFSLSARRQKPTIANHANFNRDCAATIG
jgi:hypothetical protein